MSERLGKLLSLPDLVKLARSAGTEVMKWYLRHDVPTDAKSDCSPVTAADLAANALILEGLPRLLPGVPIVSEEGQVTQREKTTLVMQSDCYWLIDPLDGTRDFLAETGDFSVNIALMVDGVPTVGCVLAPARGTCYVAEKTHGAYEQPNAGASLAKITSRIADRQRFTCLVSRSHLHGEDLLLKTIYPEAQVRRVGSALKYAQIAAGLADLAVRRSPTSLWDTAAAQCVLECAGGIMVDFEGEPLKYRTDSLINPPFLAIGDPSFPWRELLRRIAALPGIASEN